MSRRRAGWVALGALGLGVGCRTDVGQALGTARLEVRWTGSDTSAFRAPAAAEWCDSLRVLEILAMSGDTGIGIAIYPRNGIAPGAYAVRPPEAADSVPPSSAIGVRWFSQTALRGFRSDSGNLSLARGADGSLSGRFTADAHAVTGNGQLALTGSFDGLRERPATRGCATAPPPSRVARPDSQAELD